MKSVLVTGGTGSFGKKFIADILENHKDVERVVVYSRDELKQYEMAQTFSFSKYPQIRYFIGDVRDADRLKRACEGIDTVIHAAALKHVPIAEYNPMECIKTNILGAENVVNCSIEMGVKNVIALSTDKACAPINLYGATKLCSDKLFVAANNFKGKRDIKFSVVRYGNVLGSRGSVVPFFIEKKKNGVLPITHADMTRFSISLQEGVNLVKKALSIHWGGEIFVPKIPSYRILDVAQAIAPNCKIEEVGIRPGEKLHEEMISEMDSLSTVEFKGHYVIMPTISPWDQDDFIKKMEGKKVGFGFKYSSDTNNDWLTVDQLRSEIREHFDPFFEP